MHWIVFLVKYWSRGFVVNKNIYCFGYYMKETDKPASCAAELESGLSGAVDVDTEILKGLLSSSRWTGHTVHDKLIKSLVLLSKDNCETPRKKPQPRLHYRL